MKSAAVLAYHSISSRGGFETHIESLSHYGSVCSPSALLDMFSGRRSSHETRIVLTFDDLDISHIQQGGPTLKRRGWNALVFAVGESLAQGWRGWWTVVDESVRSGGTIGNQRPGDAQQLVYALKRVKNATRLRVIDNLMRTAGRSPEFGPCFRAEQVRALESQGVEVGNHTMTHPCLSMCDDGEVEREIREAHDVLAAALGHPPRFFAYPNGDYDPRAAPILDELGYLGAFLFDHRVQRLPIRDKFAISRIRISADADRARTAFLVSGIHSALWSLAGRMRTAPARRRAENLARRLEAQYGDPS